MRLLFFAEAVTLAHVARPISLVQALDRRRFEACIAVSPSRRSWVDAAGIESSALDSVSAQSFADALDKGKPVYTAQNLRDYVAADLRLIESFKPDAVIGDFRLSLSISARLARVRYLTLTNAYWSPWTRMPFPLPVIPLSRALPIPLARVLFGVGHRVAMALHCRPMNQVRREHGLASLGHALRRVYTDADTVVYADSPDTFPMDPLPPSHHFIGPVLWSPPMALPSWWAVLPADRPVIYVTLGSSGSVPVLRAVLEALQGEPVSVIASTAGAPVGEFPSGTHVHLAPYLPGDRATERSALVICNGGSMTTQQALMAGRPVLGVASNMDQFLNMAAVVKAGAGLCLRADRLDTDSLRRTIRTLLDTPSYTAAAVRVGDGMKALDPGARFAALLESRVP